MTTFGDKDFWAKSKGYTVFTNGTTGYADVYDTPNGTQLDSLMEKAYALILQRIGSAPATTTVFHKTMEYLITEALRLFEVAMKEENAKGLIDAVDKLINVLPQAQSLDLQLEAEDAVIHRGVVE